MFRYLTFLGTSSGTPTLTRNVSCVVLSVNYGRHTNPAQAPRADERVIVIDCGEGSQQQFLRMNHLNKFASKGSRVDKASVVKDSTVPIVTMSRIDTIMITHLHGDHSYGVPGLVASIALLWQAPEQMPRRRKSVGAAIQADEEETWFSKHSRYLNIYGPPGTAHYLRNALLASAMAAGHVEESAQPFNSVNVASLGEGEKRRETQALLGFRYRVYELMATAETGEFPCVHQFGEGKSGSGSRCGSTSFTSVSTVPLAPEGGNWHEQLSECLTLEEFNRKNGNAAPFSHLHPSEVEPVCILPLRGSNGTLFRFDLHPNPSTQRSEDVGVGVVPEAYGASQEDRIAINVSAALLSHTIPSLGYMFRESVQTSLPTLDINECRRRGITKGSLLGMLRKGENISFDLDGCSVIVKSEEVMMPPPPPPSARRIVILGDTANSSNMVRLAETLPSGVSGAEERINWLVHESTFDDSTADLAPARGHSTARTAGINALLMRAQRLILTHFSARFSISPQDMLSCMLGFPVVADDVSRGDSEKTSRELMRPLIEQAVEGTLGVHSQSRQALVECTKHVTDAYPVESPDPSETLRPEKKSNEIPVIAAYDFMCLDLGTPFDTPENFKKVGALIMADI